MTLNKHRLDGLPSFPSRILDAIKFEQILMDAGYSITASAPANGDRIKVWWSHPTYRRIESIYNQDKTIAITAYHPN
ncbi:hypothetical protein FJR05_23385 [Dolichospermum sp. UHCC 0259]|nr:hypothetical protein [Dolichospermum sp. UHCC 0259]